MSQKYASAIPKASKTHYLQVNTNIPNTRQPPKKKKKGLQEARQLKIQMRTIKFIR